MVAKDKPSLSLAHSSASRKFDPQEQTANSTALQVTQNKACQILRSGVERKHEPHFPVNLWFTSLGQSILLDRQRHFTMPSKYKKLIGDYCVRHGIAIPPGFVHGANRYAIIRTHLTPPKLIAATWFRTAEVLYYIEHFLLPELGDSLSQSIRILDFKEGQELAYTGGKRLDRVGSFSVTDETEAV